MKFFPFIPFMAMALFGTLTNSSPLLATRSDVRANAGACDKGVIGSANWDWYNSDGIDNLSLGLTDCDCSHDTYIQLIAYAEKNDSSNPILKRSITSGCDGKHKTWNLGRVSWIGPSPKWRIRVCKADAGPDTCYYSSWKINTEMHYPK